MGYGFGGEVLMGAADGQIYRLGRTSTGADGGASATRLLGNFPNPFNPSTTIRFTLAKAGDVRLDIVSVTGERVRRIDMARASAGANQIVWRGDTDLGGPAASGVYFCRFLVDGRVLDSSRMVLLQ
jgi:hypothetical protein